MWLQETLVQHQEVLEKLSLELEEKEKLMEELDATQNVSFENFSIDLT